LKGETFMPKMFEDCIKSGGRVRTIKPNKSTHMPVCFKGGKSFAGEPKKTKKKKGR
jgi:hypothetical protein